MSKIISITPSSQVNNNSSKCTDQANSNTTNNTITSHSLASIQSIRESAVPMTDITVGEGINSYIKLEVDRDMIIQDVKAENDVEEEEQHFMDDAARLSESGDAGGGPTQPPNGLQQYFNEVQLSQGPRRLLKYGRGFGASLTVQEMVRLHFHPEISKFDFSKQPVMVLEKVDKYWPVPKPANKTDTLQVKEEPEDDWDEAAEAEIREANRDWNRNYRVVRSVSVSPPPAKRQQSAPRGRIVTDRRRKRRQLSSSSIDEPLDSAEEENKVDSPESLSFQDQDSDSSNDSDEDVGSDVFDEMDDDNDDDYSPDNSRHLGSDYSISPDLSEINEKFRAMPEDGADDNSMDLDMISIKEEEEEGGDMKDQETRIIEIGGYQVETCGDYSKCPVCKKNIKSTFVIRHIKSHDKPVTVLKCHHKNCITSFTRTNNMYRHMKLVHDDSKPYICVYKECDQKFKESQALRRHVHVEHKKPDKKEMEEINMADMKFTCDFPGCGREYGKKQHLREHFRKHTGDMRYSCEVCGERFFVHGHMKRHLYSHTGIKPHSCRWKCGAIFASYGGRMKHERAQHSDNPYKLECSICGRPFRFDRELEKHQLTHLAPEERTAYRCSFCGIIFDSVKHRERHEQRHKDNDVFQCEECNKVFKNEKNLRHHYKAHHEQPAPQTNGSTQVSKEKKEKKEPPKYPCHMCNIPVMFALTALRRHLARKHSTNFKCDKEGCNKTFAKQYQFDAHMKLHMHRSCHICGKDFKRKQNADIHLMGVHGFTKDDLYNLGR